jgi:hypothetical protein
MTTTCVEMRAALALIAALLTGPCAAAEETAFDLAGHRYPASPDTEWALPDALRELSGFTTDAEGRLFAHNDEVAVIHEIDYARGGIVKSFALGNPPVAGDFEGIAFIEDRIALTDSNGVLYLATEGDPGAAVGFERIPTGIGARCEVEGIAYAADEGLLYFACKTARAPALEGSVTVIAWSAAQRREVTERTLSVALDRFGELPGKGKLRPSDIAIAPGSGDLILTTAKRRALLTIARDGTRVSAFRLPKSKTLKQIEALAFGSGGTLLLGSEGKDRGRMRVYRPAD